MTAPQVQVLGLSCMSKSRIWTMYLRPFEFHSSQTQEHTMVPLNARPIKLQFSCQKRQASNAFYLQQIEATVSNGTDSALSTVDSPRLQPLHDFPPFCAKDSHHPHPRIFTLSPPT